jgi:hypothetical protein
VQQRTATGKQRTHWPYDTPKCHFCRRVFNRGEEMISLGGVQANVARDMHRTCLDNWLHEHPPMDGGAAQKTQSAEDIEKEFKRIQRALRRKTASLKTPKS